MIYFDNSATGGFKPHAVTDAVNTVIRYLTANPGRSGHRLSVAGAKIIETCRNSLSMMFGYPSEHVVFTKNCTEALNLAIFGTLKSGGHVITTVYEHNSVLRPLFALKNKGLIELDVVSPKPDKPFALSIKEKIKTNTYLIVTTALSNVTGYEMPVQEIGEVAKESGVLYLIDGAQGGGHVPLNLNDTHANMLALAGHKGLYGIMGSGSLLFDNSTNPEPLIYGGTGSETLNLNQPLTYPDCLEAGTINLPAISALNEGVKYANDNMNNFANHLLSSTKKLIDGINSIPGVKCFSLPNRAGICSFKLENLPSSDVADIFNSEYDVAVRGGLHCAPLIHKFLKTDGEGLVRASLAVQNSTNEINYFISALEKIAKP